MRASDAVKFLRALAQAYEEGRVSGPSCLRILETGYDPFSRLPLIEAYSALMLPERPGGWALEDEYPGFITQEVAQEITDIRILLLCFMAAVIERRKKI